VIYFILSFHRHESILGKIFFSIGAYDLQSIGFMCSKVCLFVIILYVFQGLRTVITRIE
jgi:hypothetical protein